VKGAMQFALHAGRLARTVGTDGTKMRKIISYGELRSSRLLARKPTRKPWPVPHTPEADLHRRRQLTRGCLTHVDHEIRHRGRYEPGRSVRLDAIDSGFHGVPAGPGPDSAPALRLTGTRAGTTPHRDIRLNGIVLRLLYSYLTRGTTIKKSAWCYARGRPRRAAAAGGPAECSRAGPR